MTPSKLIILLTVFVVGAVERANSDSEKECLSRNDYDHKAVHDLLSRSQNTVGDFKRLTDFPCWFDVDLARIGQEFARRHFGQLFISNTLASILLFTHPQIQPVLLLARADDTLKQRTKGDLATAQQIFLWYQADVLSPEWFQSVQNIRKIHSSVAAQIKTRNNTNIHNPDNPPDHWRNFQRDEKMWEAFYLDLKQLDTPKVRERLVPFKFSSPYKFNQYLLLITHWFFAGLPVLNPRQLGISNHTERDLQGFLHLWSVIAYNVGLEEEFVFCKGTLDQWKECIEYLKYFFVTHYLPHLLNMNLEAELLIQGQAEVIKQFVPGIPLEFWLITLLENHLNVPGTHLRKHVKLVPGAFGSLIDWFSTKAANEVDFFRGVLNKSILTALQVASLRSFGNPGNNLTHVASDHYSCSTYLLG
ncbi:unnamed protein product [Allacma fusca]|uniref:ER-bound oxygenase mpaB/mpaB'/Rubber oxygenase catalytic domain-containing protein n=1 Tax=Allacma fusca TaxID=39272 RepID=A0A8J2JT06_9HEXA|nr:unnamed protein product [Allacma fusca]